MDEKTEGPVMIPATVGNTIFRDKERLERENAELRETLHKCLDVLEVYEPGAGRCACYGERLCYLHETIALVKLALKEQP